MTVSLLSEKLIYSQGLNLTLAYAQNASGNKHLQVHFMATHIFLQVQIVIPMVTKQNVGTKSQFFTTCSCARLTFFFLQHLLVYMPTKCKTQSVSCAQPIRESIKT